VWINNRIAAAHLETQSARILVNPAQARSGLHCIPVRPAKLATTVTSSAGSTGLTTCDWYRGFTIIGTPKRVMGRLSYLACLLPNHFVRIFVFPDSEKDWLTETIIPGPLREFYLTDHCWFDPVATLHFGSSFIRARSKLSFSTWWRTESRPHQESSVAELSQSEWIFYHQSS